MPTVQTEWVDVEQQTQALLHKSSRAAARTITACVSREAGESIVRRAPASTKTEQFLRELKDRNSLRPAVMAEEAHLDEAFQRLDPKCTGMVRAEGVCAWLLATGVQAARLRALPASVADACSARLGQQIQRLPRGVL